MSETQEMAVSAREEIRAIVEQMPDADVQALLRLLRRLAPPRDNADLMALAGTITAEDAELMRQAIEEEFERIEDDEW